MYNTNQKPKLLCGKITFVILISSIFFSLNRMSTLGMNITLPSLFSLSFGKNFFIGVAGLFSLRFLMINFFQKTLRNNKASLIQYNKYESFTYYVFLLFIIGGLSKSIPNSYFYFWVIAFLFMIGQFSCSNIPADNQAKVYSIFFLISGFSALIYQVVWQRSLFALIGINIESVTLIVSIFMFGFGVGSFLGGYLSKVFKDHLIPLFFLFEVSIGVFGLFSYDLLNHFGNLLYDKSQVEISLGIYALLAIPTCFMGATLPVLVNFLNAQYSHVGKTVGTLYFFNTIGSGIACFFVSDVLFTLLTQKQTLIIACALNLIVAFGIMNYSSSQFKIFSKR